MNRRRLVMYRRILCVTNIRLNIRRVVETDSTQGPWSNFEIGEAPLLAQYWGRGGGAQDTFSY